MAKKQNKKRTTKKETKEARQARELTLVKMEAVVNSIVLGSRMVNACKAANLSRTTFDEMRKADPEYAASVQAARATSVSSVECAQHKSCLGFFVTENGKQKYIAPNVTAQMFRLVNEDPENWQSVNRPTIENHTHTTVNLTADEAHKLAVKLGMAEDPDVKALKRLGVSPSNGNGNGNGKDTRKSTAENKG